MKKLILLCITVVFLFTAGCATLSHIPAESVKIGIDFKKYSDEGFLITPGEYGGQYTSLGFFYYSFYPEMKKISKKSNLFKWVGDEINTQGKLDIVYKDVLEQGGNGITHFKIKSINKSYRDGAELVVVKGIGISGLAIKIKD